MALIRATSGSSGGGALHGYRYVYSYGGDVGVTETFPYPVKFIAGRDVDNFDYIITFSPDYDKTKYQVVYTNSSTIQEAPIENTQYVRIKSISNDLKTVTFGSYSGAFVAIVYY